MRIALNGERKVCVVVAVASAVQRFDLVDCRAHDIMGQGRSRKDQVMSLGPKDTSSSRTLDDDDADDGVDNSDEKRSSFIGRRSFSLMEG